jgi:hypothetical protein
MNATTGQATSLGVWLMRQRRQKAKGWINPVREAKVWVRVRVRIRVRVRVNEAEKTEG